MSKKLGAPTIIFFIIVAFFAVFLLLPLLRLFGQAIWINGSLDLSQAHSILFGAKLRTAMVESLRLSLIVSVLATVFGFLFAYAVNFTCIPRFIRRILEGVITLPMLCPTIVYGFVLMYTFGKQGYLTTFFGRQLLDIYSLTGLVLGLLIYTIPTSFMLINNSMKYIDGQFFVVADLMGDNPVRKFISTIFIPLLTTLGVSIVQTFFMSFTDFGLPAAIGGTRPLIATLLYNQMIGSVPDFVGGAIIALSMLLPSVISAGILIYLKRHDVKYDKITPPLLKRRPLRDLVFGILTAIPIVFIIVVFIPIILVPFAEAYPYKMNYSLNHFTDLLTSSGILQTYGNTVSLAVMSGIFGVILSFVSALLVRRTSLGKALANGIESIALVTTAVPGMVLGVAYMFAFQRTPLHYTVAILVIANIIYFFPTPYAMASQTFEKLPGHYENTAMLLGDSYGQTLFRVILPNSLKTMIEIFGYLFIHSMTTISALIFLVGVRTKTITTEMKALQNFNKFNEIFVLALLLIVTNIVAKLLLGLVGADPTKRLERKARRKKGIVQVSPEMSIEKT